MKYRRLGKTNLRVSVIGIGTWQFGGEWNKTFEQSEVDTMFDRCRHHGINLIDTAECYGDHTSEALIGPAIQRDRAKWIVATKFGHKFHKPFERTEPRSPKDVAQQLEESLRALKTDYVDLLQYHSWGDNQYFDQDVNATCIKLVESGKVRHLGNSVSKNDNIGQIEKSASMKIEAIQIIYNRLQKEPEEKVFASCMAQDLGVLARVPLASGFLSGKYKPGATFDPKDVRGKWNDPKRDDKLREIEKIKETEVPKSVDMAQWALAWCLKHPAVSCVIPGCKNVEQVDSNASAARLEIVQVDHPQAWRE